MGSKREYFTYKGITYEVLYDDTLEDSIQSPSWMREQLDFAVSVGDFTTVNNRIIGGLSDGWLRTL